MRPLAHPRCHCTMIPVLESMENLGIPGLVLPDATRATMDGQVSEKVRLDAWLKSQSVDRQNTILGKTRARWLRNGDIEVKQLSDMEYRVYTIRELEQKYGITA